MACSAGLSAEEARARLLIDETARLLELNLDGLSVLTEMASGHYVYTPLIAALAGAGKVAAIVKESQYGSRNDIIDRGLRLADSWQVRERIEVLSSVSPTDIAQADIITNLGFIRPIDATFVSQMKHGAVIPYMREAWEYRPGDVDLIACRAENIPVMGTSENYDGLKIFDFCGPLATKMLYEAGLEVKGSRIIVASRDNFGNAIGAYLDACGAEVHQVNGSGQFDLETTKRIDAILVACFVTDEVIVGRGGWFDPSALANYHPECTVVQICGNLDIESLNACGVHCVPERPVEARRMAQTLAALGPRPVIELHTAGLKVGELMWHKMRTLQDAREVEQSLAKELGLCQRLGKIA